METSARISRKALLALGTGLLALDLGVLARLTGLRLLLVAAAACWLSAVLLAIFGWREVCRAPDRLRGKGLIAGGVVLAVAAVLGLILPPLVREARDRSARQDAAGRMQCIVRALNAYAADHGGRLPPAVVCDSGGKPLYSWRVLLLPYLGHDDLYRQFNLDEPWDSAHNRALLPRMPDVYAPPPAADADNPPFTTFCQVPVGMGGAFADPQGAHLPSLPEGGRGTILVVEAGEPVPWTRPEDLAYPTQGKPSLGGVFKRRAAGLFGPRRNSGFHVVLGDGSAHFLTTPHNSLWFDGTMLRAGVEPEPEPLGTQW